MPTTVLTNFLSWWVERCRHFAWPIVIGALVLGGLSIQYTRTNIGVDTDTADMIAKDLPWRQTFIEYKKDFPQFVDTLLLVVDADTPDRAEEAAARLAGSIRRESDLIDWVKHPGNDAFFRQNGLLYLDDGELERLSENLTRIQPFLGTLIHEPTLPGLFSIVHKALSAQGAEGSLELTPVLNAVAATVEAENSGHFYRLSWQRLMQIGVDQASDARRYIVVKPKLDYSELLPAGPALHRIRSLASTLELIPGNGVHVRITGEPALAYEEFASATRGTKLAFLLSVVMVTVVLLIGLRSVWLLVATLVTLLLGLSWTAAFATLAIGHLNLISIAFAVLYIGLGVDYAIHYCLRCRELNMSGVGWPDALDRGARDVGTALVICAVTTGVGFFAFAPTNFTGVSELGIISGTGMFISLVASLTVLPALLELGPRPRPGFDLSQPPSGAAQAASWPLRHRRGIRLAAVALALASLLALPHVRFDDNPLNLRDPESESVSTVRDLMADGGRSFWTMSAMARDGNDARALAQRITELPEVKGVINLESFIPAGQAEKFAVIEDLGLLLSLDITAITVDISSNPASRLAASMKLIDALKDFAAGTRTPAEQNAARRLSLELTTLLGKNDAAKRLASLEQSLMYYLPAQLESLKNALSPQEISLQSLPAELKRDWIAPDGRWRLEVEPSGEMSDERNLARFVDAVRSIAPDVTGAPVVHLESGRAVVRAFSQALLAALLLISVLLFVVLQRVLEVGLVLAPLLFATLIILAVMVIFGLPFNFANVIALPLLLGLGANNGIHMVYRWRAAPPDSGDLLKTSTARGVVFSVLTTMCSFGNLAFTAHRGTASMGLLLALGLTVVLLCTLLLTPALQPDKMISAAAE
ncbi:MAG: MMPL family transporter [Gammaproteobacteria bacterium]|nr:MMPL family transporter [Gammaproteobacteria bacterium]